MRYRRDISSTLKLLALVLILFVGYQVWLKPAYFAPGQTADHPPSTTPSPSPSELALSDLPKNPTWDVPPSRLLILGPEPNQELGSIREEFDRGNYNEVERRLKTLSQKKLRHVSTRQYVAALWNNLGIQQEKFGGTALSIKAFKQAVAWDPVNPLAHLNLTQAYWELRDPGMTPQFLETVIRLVPQDPFPHLALADLLLMKGQARLAVKHLELARPQAERDPNHQSYLRNLLARVAKNEPLQTAAEQTKRPPQSTHPNIAREPETSPILPASSSPALTSQPRTADRPPQGTPPPQPTQLDTAHFTVQFDGPPDQATWIQMRAILKYAYEELTQKFGHVPFKPITVVLHTNQKFAGTAGSPAWADTLFDQSSGTIHMPAQEALEDLAVFSRIVRHEFAHALLYEFLKGQSALVPTWLIEGVAIQLAEDPWPDMEVATATARTVIPLTDLHGEWKQLPREPQLAAYIEALSTTQTMIDRFSMYNVRQLMNLLQTGQSIDAAMQKKFSISYKQFESLWTEQFTSQLNSRKS